MSYMIEGGGSPTLSRAKAWLYRHQNSSHQLLQAITDVSVEYLVGQVAAGAQMLQVFESHAGLLGRGLFLEFCLPYLKQISHKVKRKLKEQGLETVPMVSSYCITAACVIPPPIPLALSLLPLFRSLFLSPGLDPPQSPPLAHSGGVCKRSTLCLEGVG